MMKDGKSNLICVLAAVCRLLLTIEPGYSAGNLVHSKWVSIPNMVKAELDWIESLESSVPLSEREDDAHQTLLSGHLTLLSALLQFRNPKGEVELCGRDGPTLVRLLIDHFLFAPSRMLAEGHSNPATGDNEVLATSHCRSNDARAACYQLLVELARASVANLAELVRLLVLYLCSPTPWLGKFELQPEVYPRAGDCYVGLKNACATCYMNSTLQQLALHPAMRQVCKLFFGSVVLLLFFLCLFHFGVYLPFILQFL